MNQQELEIAEINSIAKATLGVSKIDGVGVIAIKTISKGEVIHADRIPKIYHIPYGSINKLFPEVRDEILKSWPNIINGSKFIYPNCRLLSYMNHMDSPWDNYDPLTDTAKREISRGEEITENYCSMENAEKVYPWLNCENNVIIKETWLTIATSAIKSKSLKNIHAVRLVKWLTKNFVRN